MKLKQCVKIVSMLFYQSIIFFKFVINIKEGWSGPESCMNNDPIKKAAHLEVLLYHHKDFFLFFCDFLLVYIIITRGVHFRGLVIPRTMPSCLSICLTLLNIVRFLSNFIFFIILTVCGVLEHLLKTTIDDSSNTQVKNSFPKDGLRLSFPRRIVSTESQTEIVYCRPRNRKENNCPNALIYNSDTSKRISKAHLNGSDVKIDGSCHQQQTPQTMLTGSVDIDDKNTHETLSGYFSEMLSTYFSKVRIEDAIYGNVTKSFKSSLYFQDFLLPISRTFINKLNIRLLKAVIPVSFQASEPKCLLDKNTNVGDRPIIDLIMGSNLSNSNCSKFSKIASEVEMTCSNMKLKKIDAQNLFVKNVINGRIFVFLNIHNEAMEFSNTASKLQYTGPTESVFKAYINNTISVSAAAFHILLDSGYSTVVPIEATLDHKSLTCYSLLSSYGFSQGARNYPNKANYSIKSVVAPSEYLNNVSSNSVMHRLKKKLKINQTEHFSEIGYCEYGLKILNTEVEYLLRNLPIPQLGYLSLRNENFKFGKVLILDDFNSDNFEIKYEIYQFRNLNNRKSEKDDFDDDKTFLIRNNPSHVDSFGKDLSNMNNSEIDRDSKEINKDKIILDRSRNERASLHEILGRKSEKDFQLCPENVPICHEMKLAGREMFRQSLAPKVIGQFLKELNTSIDKGNLACLMQDLQSQTNKSLGAMFDKVNEVVEFLESNPEPSKDTETTAPAHSRRPKKKRRRRNR